MRHGGEDIRPRRDYRNRAVAGHAHADHARARLRNLSPSKSGEVEDFEYGGKRIAEDGGIEGEAERIAVDVEHGMDEMARDIRDKLVNGE